MNWIRIRELVRKEFIQLFRDKKNRPLLIIAPLVQLILFGYVVQLRCPRHPGRPCSISRTPESRMLVDAFGGNKTFRITDVVERPGGAGSLLLMRKGRSGHQDSAGFQRDRSARGKPPKFRFWRTAA